LILKRKNKGLCTFTSFDGGQSFTPNEWILQHDNQRRKPVSEHPCASVGSRVTSCSRNTKFYFETLKTNHFTALFSGEDSKYMYRFQPVFIIKFFTKSVCLFAVRPRPVVRLRINPKDEAYLFYIRTQCVPRCKHSPLRL
jgi:hypothetical protein